MSVDRIYLQRAARDIKESPEYLPYSKVRIIVGEDENGVQLVYEAGDDSFRTLEITNPYGTQAIANSILAKIQGYSYKPYTADGAILNPAAELGDAVNVGNVYSFISSMDTTFSALMSATISAPEDSNIDHEYPFETSEHKEIARKINGVRTSFTVELGRIASEIEETYQTKTAAGQQYTQLQSSIEQTAQSITATVAATYETKNAATQMEQRLNSTITQTANSITSTVSATYETKSDATAKLNTAKTYADAQDNAKAATITAEYRSEIAQTADSIKATVAASESKYAVPSGVSIAVYGYGAPPNSIAAAYNGRYYLDQSSGYYYRSNGTSWVKQNNTPLKLITDNLSSSITQTADSIRSEVRASYQSKADADNDYNTLYSFIEQRADSITLSVSSSANGRTTFTLKDGSTTLDSEALYLNVRSANIVGTITADAVAARATITSPNVYGGRYYDEDGRGSLYMDYGVGEGTLMYGYSSVDRMSDAFFGIQGDYVSNLANLYLAGSRRLEGVFGGRVYAYGTWDFSNATVILPS